MLSGIVMIDFLKRSFNYEQHYMASIVLFMGHISKNGVRQIQPKKRTPVLVANCIVLYVY